MKTHLCKVILWIRKNKSIRFPPPELRNSSNNSNHSLFIYNYSLRVVQSYSSRDLYAHPMLSSSFRWEESVRILQIQLTTNEASNLICFYSVVHILGASALEVCRIHILCILCILWVLSSGCSVLCPNWLSHSTYPRQITHLQIYQRKWVQLTDMLSFYFCDMI